MCGLGRLMEIWWGGGGAYIEGREGEGKRAGGEEREGKRNKNEKREKRGRRGGEKGEEKEGEERGKGGRFAGDKVRAGLDTMGFFERSGK